MKLQIDFKPPQYPFSIHHDQKLLLLGSCFTSNLGEKLSKLYFDVTYNPSGILFDPLSIVAHLQYFLDGRAKDHLFYDGDIWHDWLFHSDFSATTKEKHQVKVKQALTLGAESLQQADVLFITLGSAFTYRLTDNGLFVANCHRQPQGLFQKQLLSVEEILHACRPIITRLLLLKPNIHFVFTISPVRHVRDGVIENNRSKARLIEAVHQLVDDFTEVHYFPAYELVIDVLRDYRFYDVDLVHPNFAATEEVFQYFVNSFLDPETSALLPSLQAYANAMGHKVRFPDSKAHAQFLLQTDGLRARILGQCPWLEARLP